MPNDLFAAFLHSLPIMLGGLVLGSSRSSASGAGCRCGGTSPKTARPRRRSGGTPGLNRLSHSAATLTNHPAGSRDQYKTGDLAMLQIILGGSLLMLALIGFRYALSLRPHERESRPVPAPLWWYTPS